MRECVREWEWGGTTKQMEGQREGGRGDLVKCGWCIYLSITYHIPQLWVQMVHLPPCGPAS